MKKAIDKQKKIIKIMAVLGPLYPDHKPLLNFNNTFELLIATLLTAQCTDKAVNLITPKLFKHFPDPVSMAKAPLKELEILIHSLGFFRAKSHNIKALSRLLIEKYNSCVPETMEELVTLPGVGRKTASVILSTCFGKPAIIVDTHFSRICNRLGLSSSQRPDIIERDIAAIAPKENWTEISHVLNRFGRTICQSRKPLCEKCPVRDYCLYVAVN